jgi:nitroreductase
MANNFEAVKETILTRRNVKPAEMNGQAIDDAIVHELLELGNWAPTHARTEPWHFFVYSGQAVQQFCAQHAQLYKSATPEERYNEGTFTNLGKMGDKASHILVACMKRGSNEKIPVLEEIAAASCAVQNILLAAEARGIAVYWGSGGMAYKPEMRNMLGLGAEDLVLGILYLGYTSEPKKEGKRNSGIDAKLTWNKG